MNVSLFGFGLLQETLAFRSIKYGYSNSRTKALWASLLSKKEFDSMIASKSLQDIVGVLQRTNYSQDLISEAFAFSRADLIELALSKNFSRTLAKLIKISPKSDHAQLNAIFERYDVQNLKNLFFGMHLQIPKEQILLLLVDSPKFNKSHLRRLLELKSIKQVVEKLKGSEYYRALDNGLLEYEKTGEISAIVSGLDSYYYKKSFNAGKLSAGKTVRSMLMAELDAKNIMTVLRAKKENFSLEKTLSLMIEGGKISKKALEELFGAKTIEEIIEKQKLFEMQKPLSEFRKDGSLSHFENEFEKIIAQAGLRELRKSILSLSAIVGFLFLKEEEIKNIRKIVRSKEFDFEEDKIRQLLVIV